LSHEDWDFVLNLCINGRNAQKCESTYLNYRSHDSARNNRFQSKKDRSNYAKLYSYIVEKYRKTHGAEFNYLSGKLFADWYIYVDQRFEEVEKDFKTLKETTEQKDHRIYYLETELNSIKNSRAWKTIQKARHIKSRIRHS
jgi:hypothetical protein